MAQCSTCGSEVRDDNPFCPNCGTDLKASPSPAGAPSDASLSPAAPAPPAAADASAQAAIPDPAAPSTAPPGAAAEEGGILEDPAAPTAGSAPPPEADPGAAAPLPPADAAPAPAGGGSARLTLRRGGSLTSDIFPLGERVTVGRFDPETGPIDVDLGQLPEVTYLSRKHAEIWRDGGQWYLKDLGSRNGTFVRSTGERDFRRAEGDHALKDGDEIGFGNARFEFRVS